MEIAPPVGNRPHNLRLSFFLALGLVLPLGAQQQQQPLSFPYLNEQPSQAEQQDLAKALAEAQTSPIDLIRALEVYLEKYPKSEQRAEVERALAKAAIDTKDPVRIVKYGPSALAAVPDDVLVLDRLSNALLVLGGAENAEKAIRYAREFEDLIEKMGVAEGKDSMQRQEERDRARGRVVLYQAHGRMLLGQPDEAARLTERSFSIYPNEESARRWAEALIEMRREGDALFHLAEAFAIPDAHATGAQRQEDRLELGRLYAKLNGSEKGLGDLILDAYDRTSTIVERRRQKLLAMDPNSTLADPMEFTVTDLDGKKLKLSSLKGKIVVMDFWATWCVPCRTQHPLYEEVKKRYAGRQDVLFLQMNTDEDRSIVPTFLNEQQWEKTTYFDDGLARLLQVTSIPTTVLFGKDGRVASRMNGFLAETFVDQLTARIRDLAGPAR